MTGCQCALGGSGRQHGNKSKDGSDRTHERRQHSQHGRPQQHRRAQQGRVQGPCAFRRQVNAQSILFRSSMQVAILACKERAVMQIWIVIGMHRTEAHRRSCVKSALPLQIPGKEQVRGRREGEQQGGALCLLASGSQDAEQALRQADKRKARPRPGRECSQSRRQQGAQGKTAEGAMMSRHCITILAEGFDCTRWCMVWGSIRPANGMQEHTLCSVYDGAYRQGTSTGLLVQ